MICCEKCIQLCMIGLPILHLPVRLEHDKYKVWPLHITTCLCHNCRAIVSSFIFHPRFLYYYNFLPNKLTMHILLILLSFKMINPTLNAPSRRCRSILIIFYSLWNVISCVCSNLGTRARCDHGQPFRSCQMNFFYKKTRKK
jgi:hypothetical protein